MLMKTILVLATHPDLPDAVRSALSSEEYRLIHRVGIADAEPFLQQRLLDLCIVDVPANEVGAVWLIEQVHRRLPSCPIVIYTSAREWDWEEEAYSHGVVHVLPKPVKPRVLLALLGRYLAASHRSPAPAPVPVRPARREPVTEAEAVHREGQALGVLRNLSTILTHSLCAEGLLKQFILLLREIVGVNRVLIFLRRPGATFGGVTMEEGHCLRAACAMGLSSGLLEHFELSTESGIGSYLFRQGRVLRRDSDVAQNDIEMQKEFEIMGAEVAVPVLDRETFLGVAVFDGRVTGEPLGNSELELIFHLLEEVGLAIKNIWLHDQLSANHEMMTDIFRQLSSGCIVVSRDLTILHANKAARGFFGRPGRGHSELEFTDLPQLLGSKIYQVLKTGAALTTFKYEAGESPGAGPVYQVTILPFQKQAAALPSSALVVAEDCTRADQLQRLELEATSLRLVRSMADRLAHEINNALVPMSTHQQMLAQKHQDPEFRLSLNTALADGVKRIARLASQMRFLVRDSLLTNESFPLEPLIEEAFLDARKHQPVQAVHLSYENGSQLQVLSGDRSALKHAFTEVLINALQANPADAKISVRALLASEPSLGSGIRVEVQDNGPGFDSEAIGRASEPFFTTRAVGLGLGLTVTRKIIETHRGTLAMDNAPESHAGLVRIFLPSSQQP